MLPPKHYKARAVILILICTLAPRTVFGQEVELPLGRLSLGQFITAVEKQTRYTFAYDAASVDTTAVLRLEPLDATLPQMISRANATSPYSLDIRGRYIIITATGKLAGAGNSNTNKSLPGYRANLAPERDLRPNPRPAGQTGEPRQPAPAAIHDTLPEPLPWSDYRPVAGYSILQNRLPRMAVKTNLLYGGATLTPNLTAEAAISPQLTLSLSGSYNPWKRKASLADNRKLLHWALSPRVNYWLCDRFEGHFLSAGLSYSRYNISEYKIPTLFRKEYRYKGYAAGVSFSYGCHIPFSDNWGLELSAGIGAAYLSYDRYDCTLCSRDPQRGSKFWVGPSNVSASIVFTLK